MHEYSTATAAPWPPRALASIATASHWLWQACPWTAFHQDRSWEWGCWAAPGAHEAQQGSQRCQWRRRQQWRTGETLASIPGIGWEYFDLYKSHRFLFQHQLYGRQWIWKPCRSKISFDAGILSMNLYSLCNINFQCVLPEIFFILIAILLILFYLMLKVLHLSLSI